MLSSRVWLYSSGFHFFRLIIADELDFLITKDRAVLHDLFMLTTYPFSRCILIGNNCKVGLTPLQIVLCLDPYSCYVCRSGKCH